MATAGNTKIFNSDFNISWSFDVLPTPRVGRKGVVTSREPLFSYADEAVDNLLDWLEREDSPVARAVCYGFFTLGSLYLTGHVLLALLN